MTVASIHSVSSPLTIRARPWHPRNVLRRRRRDVGLLLATAFAGVATGQARDARAQSSDAHPPGSPDAPPGNGHVTPPRVITRADSVVPPNTLRPGQTAYVHVLIEIDASGHVTDVTLAHTSGIAALDDNALAAVRAFVFEPARMDGVAVPVRIRYRYAFQQPVEAPVRPVVPAPVAPVAPAATPRPASPDEEQGVTVRVRSAPREVVRREISAEEIRRIPGAHGDALLAIQNFPGVARPPFSIGQFIVRSSAPEDSLVTLEGQPILLPFHFGGFASTIATDLIDTIEFLPGNFSTRYGRVAGGVINVTLRQPARDRVHAVVDFDPVDIGVYASAPLGPHASVGIGARRSLIDLVAPIVTGLIGGTGGAVFRQWPYYWDAQVAVDWDVTPRDRLRFVGAANEDTLIVSFNDPSASDPNVRGAISTHLAFAGVQSQWRHTFAPGVMHTFAPAFAYSLTAAAVGPEVNFTFISYVLYLRDEFEFRLGRHARVFVGTDSQFGWLDNDVRAPPLPTNGIADPIDPSTVVSYRDKRTFFNPAGYIEAEIQATRDLRLLAGVRVDYFGLLNAATINPRANVVYTVLPNVVARFGYGLFSTPPRGQYIVPGFGNPNLVPERWMHFTAGFNIQIIPGVLEFDNDVFIKLGDQVVSPSFRQVANAQGQLEPEHFANTGAGRVIGAEWMVRVSPGRNNPVYGLLSYTYQRAERSACPGCVWATYQYDQPHILSATVGAILPFGFEVGFRARYTSGSVEPLVTGGIYDADHDVSLTLTDPNNPGRLPGYFALDFRTSKTFRAGPIRGQVILEVSNFTNNNNPESRIYSYDRRTSQLIYGLPILPSLGIRAEY